MDRNLGTEKQYKETDETTDDEENYKAEENGKEENAEEGKYSGGRPSLFQEASWQQRQEEEARVAREAQDAAYKRMTTLSKAI